jgi:DNA-binding transcriptional regulator GbsR (MarR family)
MLSVWVDVQRPNARREQNLVSLKNKLSVNIENSKIIYNLYDMKHSEAKEKFIETWGTLGSQWGINKSIAQIQALLLVAPQPLTTDDIMEELKMSRGNASMSIRQLLDWGIVYKKSVAGDRKEYFVAEKDVWKWAIKIGGVRKQRELNPVLDLLQEIASNKEATRTEEEKEFVKQIKELNAFTQQLGKLADNLFLSPKGELLLKILKMFA